jgi:hypothetical protein
LRIQRALPTLTLLAAVALPAVPGHGLAADACLGTDGTTPLQTSELGLASGHYVLPTSAETNGADPTGLVVMAHGYQNDSSAWDGVAVDNGVQAANHLADAAAHGAVAVAMDYTGLQLNNADRGWPAREGAADLVSAAQYFTNLCHSITDVVIIGVSMGGNMSGLAVADSAGVTRWDGSPLFNYWVDVEGVTNVIETYTEARAVGADGRGNAYAYAAQQDIEGECGGPIESEPSCYQSIDVLAQIGSLAKSGISGVTVSHAVEDGLVPSDQSREISTALRANGIPVDQYNVLLRDYNNVPGDNPECQTQTTGISDATSAAGITAVTDVLAGHQWEGSNCNVIATGFAAVWRDLTGVSPGLNGESVVSGDNLNAGAQSGL